MAYTKNFNMATATMFAVAFGLITLGALDIAGPKDHGMLQTALCTGSAGTFQLMHGASTSAAIAYGASQADVQAAFRLMPDVDGTSTVSFTKGVATACTATGTNVMVFAFAGPRKDQRLMTSLPSVAVAPVVALTIVHQENYLLQQSVNCSVKVDTVAAKFTIQYGSVSSTAIAADATAATVQAAFRAIALVPQDSLVEFNTGVTKACSTAAVEKLSGANTIRFTLLGETAAVAAVKTKTIKITGATVDVPKVRTSCLAEMEHDKDKDGVLRAMYSLLLILTVIEGVRLYVDTENTNRSWTVLLLHVATLGLVSTFLAFWLGIDDGVGECGHVAMRLPMSMGLVIWIIGATMQIARIVWVTVVQTTNSPKPMSWLGYTNAEIRAHLMKLAIPRCIIAVLVLCTAASVTLVNLIPDKSCGVKMSNIYFWFTVVAVLAVVASLTGKNSNTSGKKPARWIMAAMLGASSVIMALDRAIAYICWMYARNTRRRSGVPTRSSSRCLSYGRSWRPHGRDTVTIRVAP